MRIYNAGSRVMNTYVYPIKEGYVMVDTGYENSFARVKKRLRRQGIELREVRYVFLTHAHDDHAGFLRKMLEENPQIRVIAAEKEISGLRRG